MNWKGNHVWIVFLWMLNASLPGFGQEAIFQLPAPLPAQTPTQKSNSPYHLQSLRVSHGLNSDHITALLQDRRGYIWIGYDRLGISRYDGRKFTHFSNLQGFTNNPVQCLFEDSKGNIWIGTESDGLWRYDGDRMIRWGLNHGLPALDIQSLSETKEGQLWVATGDSGAARFDGEKFEAIPGLEGKMRGLCADHQGGMWLGRRGGGLAHWNSEKVIFYPEAPENIKTVMVDQADNLWIGGYETGVTCYDGEHWRSWNIQNGMSDDRVVSMLQDREGNFWFGTYSGGVSFFDGETFSVFDEGVGLDHNHITCLMEDESGNIWLGTAGGGIDILRPHSFLHHALGLGSGSTKVKAITEDQWGHLWVATSRQGLLRYKNGQIQQYTTTNGLNSDHLSALTIDKQGILWIGTVKMGLNRAEIGPSGIIRLQNHGKTVPELENITVLSLRENAQEILLIGTAKRSLIQLDKQRAFYPTSIGETDSVQAILSILELTSGDLLFQMKKGFLQVWDGNTLTPLTDDPRMEHMKVVCMHETKDGLIWIGTDGDGLIRYNGSEFKRFTTREGLISNFIASLQSDPQGRLWIGTSKGLNRLAWDGEKISRVTTFTEMDGLKVTNNFRNAVWLDHNHHIWWGGTQGLAELDLNRPPSPQNAPSLFLESLEINQHFLDFRNPEHSSGPNSSLASDLLNRYHSPPPWFNFPDNLRLPHHLNHLTFHFTALDWYAPHKIQFTYQLEGLNESWSAPSTENKADYRNLSPGNYTFRVKTRGELSDWGPETTYDFVIRPPWWQTWWARTAYLLLVLFLILILFKWRVASLKKRQKQLETTVTERTAEVVAQKEEILKEKEHSDKILQNILPEETAEELKQHGFVKAKTYDQVSVLFTDFKGFTKVSEKLTSEELVEEIHYCYKAFDIITERFKVEKIKTIGDAYMAAGGLPRVNPNNPVNTVKAALAIRDFMEVYQKRRRREGREPFEIRIGVHTGPVVAGIVGIKKFAYDIWGDTVNTAARMESSGEVGQVNISGATYHLVKDHFSCQYRGKVPAKNKGDLDMYFVDHPES